MEITLSDVSFGYIDIDATAKSPQSRKVVHGTRSNKGLENHPPIVVIPFTMVFEGERPSLHSLLGGAIAVGGVVALTLWR